MLIEGLPFEGGQREADRFSGYSSLLSRLQCRFGQIEGHQAGIDMGESRALGDRAWQFASPVNCRASRKMNSMRQL